MQEQNALLEVSGNIIREWDCECVLGGGGGALSLDNELLPRCQHPQPAEAVLLKCA